MKKILFACVENAGRSQMAEAFAKRYGEGKFIVSSAGNKPAERVNPVVVEVMKEKSIDISMNQPKLTSAKMAQEADLIVTLGAAMTRESALDHFLNLQLNGGLKTPRESL